LALRKQSNPGFPTAECGFQPHFEQVTVKVRSAVFAEVKVDEQIGIIRVTRAVSAIAAGRILNTKTASSQIIGGVVWSIGMALHEETLIDHRFCRIMNANIVGYHVPVNAGRARHQGYLRRRAG
jgi:xanthine dehydrogenase YagR molybdenum-binding subunit